MRPEAQLQPYMKMIKFMVEESMMMAMHFMQQC